MLIVALWCPTPYTSGRTPTNHRFSKNQKHCPSLNSISHSAHHAIHDGLPNAASASAQYLVAPCHAGLGALAGTAKRVAFFKFRWQWCRVTYRTIPLARTGDSCRYQQNLLRIRRLLKQPRVLHLKLDDFGLISQGGDHAFSVLKKPGQSAELLVREL